MNKALEIFNIYLWSEFNSDEYIYLVENISNSKILWFIRTTSYEYGKYGEYVGNTSSFYEHGMEAPKKLGL